MSEYTLRYKDNGKYHVVADGEYSIMLGIVRGRYTIPMVTLPDWSTVLWNITRNTDNVVITTGGKPDPTPEPPSDDSSPQQIDRRNFQWRYKANKAAQFTSPVRDNIGLTRYNFYGVPVAFQLPTGETYNIDFATEAEDNLVHVIMYVNGRLHMVETYAGRAMGKYKLLSYSFNVNGEITTKNTRFNLTENSLIEATWTMVHTFADGLRDELQAIPTPIAQAIPLSPAPKPIEIPFMVGDKVIYEGKPCEIIYILENGMGGVPHLGIIAPTKTKKGWSTTVITRPLSEFEGVSLQAVA